MDVVCDAVGVEQLVKLLIVNPVGAFDLAVEVRGAGPDVDVPDLLVFQMPVELGLELRAVVGLHRQDAERQPAADVVDKPNCRPLVAGVEDLQHADAGAVVDRGELIEAFARAWQTLQELHVDLNPKAGLGLLVAEPTLFVALMFLVGR
jgi:hypothetical protein